MDEKKPYVNYMNLVTRLKSCAFTVIDPALANEAALAIQLLCVANADYRKQSEGEWVANPHISISKRGRTIHYATFKCSVCGKWNGRKKQKYCPKCGAKMKGGAE